MTDRNKGRPPAPLVQVIRRAPAPTTPSTPTTTVNPGPVRPAGAPAPRPTANMRAPVARPSPTIAIPSGPRAARAPSNRPPPTAEQIAALARKERVPNRIAKGELDGKMKCRIWKKLHAEEAKRFDEAWTLVEKTPGLELPDAFGVAQSGLTVEEFNQRRARMKKRAEVKEARSAVNGERLDAFISQLVASKAELSMVLGERTLIDVLTGVQPVAFDCERTGRLEKLNLVLLTRKSTWDAMGTSLVRDNRLSQKPASVSRQPSRRPVNDPRAFLELVGQSISISLRNGIGLIAPLLAVGPFDVLLGSGGAELFIPLHAMLSWTTPKV